MNRIAKAIGCGFGYGLGIAGWVGVFAAGSLYGKYQAYKLARDNPEKFLEQSDHHDEVDATGDKIMKDLGVL